MPVRAPVRQPDACRTFGRCATGDNIGRQVRFMERIKTSLLAEIRNRSVHALVRVGSAAMLAPFAIGESVFARMALSPPSHTHDTSCNKYGTFAAGCAQYTAHKALHDCHHGRPAFITMPHERGTASAFSHWPNGFTIDLQNSNGGNGHQRSVVCVCTRSSAII